MFYTGRDLSIILRRHPMTCHAQPKIHELAAKIHWFIMFPTHQTS